MGIPAMKTTVGRIYRFRAIHSLPDFPEPWCFPHQHDYTVEVEAEGGTPTDRLDDWWDEKPRTRLYDLNDVYDGPTTVENIAADLLDSAPPVVRSVTVWEDKQRWGKAKR